MNTKATEDRRSLRTKDLVFEAFFALVQARRYDEIKAGDIIERAGIGKSTFYEHFTDKDDVLSQSLIYPMGIIADAVTGTAGKEKLPFVLDHFWQRRRFARVILRHPTLRIAQDRLEVLLMTRLEKTHPERDDMALLAAKAKYISTGLLSVLHDWLTGKLSVETQDVVRWIETGALEKSND